MINSDQLRNQLIDTVLPTTTTHRPTGPTIINTSKVLDEMKAHNLDASNIEYNCNSHCISIIWLGEIHKIQKMVRLHIFDTGAVICEASEGLLLHKMWEVSDLTKQKIDKILAMTLNESLEYIRHYVWANYDN